MIKLYRFVKNSELYNRIISDTPIFFKRLQKIALLISGMCSAIIIFYTQLPQSFIDTIPIYLIKYITISGIVAIAIAQLPKVDNINKSNDVKTNKNLISKI